MGKWTGGYFDGKFHHSFEAPKCVLKHLTYIHVFCKCGREMFLIGYTNDGFEEWVCPCGKTFRKGIQGRE
jgi:hypothetical protein